MSTADDAFDKLLNKNALNIPVANPAADMDARRRTPPNPAPQQSGAGRGGGNARAAAGMNAGGSVRVMNVMDTDAIGDYHPRGAEDDEKSDVFATPTETDLDAVLEEDDAPRRPTRAMEKSPLPTEEFEEETEETGERNGVPATSPENNPVDDPGREDEPDMNTDANADADADFREAPVVDDSSPSAPASGSTGMRMTAGTTGTALDKARRVRRFSYLPLAGIESFELRARDIMAGLVSQKPDMPSLAVVGSAHGDGQTEVAFRLALAVAKRVDYRIALVDMDVRRPQVAKRLGLSSKYFTATDVLRGGCQLGEALVFGEEENLYVLPSRASDRDGDEVLDAKQVMQLMGQLHSTFDFVILCCGPMDHADATILCRHAGAAALAGFCRHTKASALRDAAERLADAGVPVAGLLLTGAA